MHVELTTWNFPAAPDENDRQMYQVEIVDGDRRLHCFTWTHETKMYNYDGTALEYALRNASDYAQRVAKSYGLEVVRSYRG